MLTNAHEQWAEALSQLAETVTDVALDEQESLGEGSRASLQWAVRRLNSYAALFAARAEELQLAFDALDEFDEEAP